MLCQSEDVVPSEIVSASSPWQKILEKNKLSFLATF